MSRYKKRFFLDHNATTFPSEKVIDSLHKFSSWGNPSSIHSSGRSARSVILKARRNLAEHLGCLPRELSFTSGGSESNNMILKGVLKKIKERGLTTIITSAVEHPSVLKTLSSLDPEEFNVVYIPVTKEKGFDYKFFKETLGLSSVGLVSVMFANNETGEIFDLKKLITSVREKEKKTGQRIYFHSDMVQALGKESIKLNEFDLDFTSFSAHKFYSLQGAGVSFHKRGVGVDPLINGGGQERGRRAGTENILSIHAFGEQISSLRDVGEKSKKIQRLRDFMETEVLEKISGVRFLAQDRNRLCNTSLMLIEGVHGETMLMNMDLLGFEISTGAACSSGTPEPSPVLLAMGLSNKEASKSLRVSLGWGTTQEEIQLFVEALEKVVVKIRGLSVGNS